MNVNLFPVLTDTDRKLPFYITCAGEWDNQDPVNRRNGFPDYQWLQCMGGKGRLHLGEKTYEVGPGQGMLLMPNETHRYLPVDKPWRVRWIGFNGSQSAPVLDALGLTASGIRYHRNPERTLQKMEEAIDLLRSNHPRRTADGSPLVYSLMMDLYQWTSPTEIRMRKPGYEQMAPLFAYIEKHYAEPITLEQLAGQISVSVQHTCLLFQQTIGMRPFEYITKYRLRKAKELLLQEPDVTVRDIARRTGYEHPSYFIRLFRRQEGVTPNQFRRMYRTPLH